MTREGIYVGGKEVVQRYVGTRLVWDKTGFELIGTFNCFMVQDYSTLSLSVHFRDDSPLRFLHEGIYYLKSKNPVSKYPFVKARIRKISSGVIKLSFDAFSDFIYGTVNWVEDGDVSPRGYNWLDVPFYRKIGV